MPTLSSSMLPPPRNWDEFEDVTLSALKIKWKSPSLTRHGRQGQPQCGVDIYGPNEVGALVGVQCKLSSADIAGGPATLVQAAEAFQPLLYAFYFATASAADVSLQRTIRQLSTTRVAAGKFPVGIFFWSDLVQELVKDRDELCKHYPQFCQDTSPATDQNVRLLALVTLAYYGLNLNYYIELLFGEFGRMAQEDPRQFSVITRTIATCASTALGPSDSELIRRHLEVLGSRVFEAYEAPEDVYNPWRRPQDLANEIEAYVRNVEYTLNGRPLWAFRTGDILARCNRVELNEGTFPAALRAKLVQSLGNLFARQGIPTSITEELERYDPTSIASSSIGDRIHALVREHIRFEALDSEEKPVEA